MSAPTDNKSTTAGTGAGAGGKPWALPTSAKSIANRDLFQSNPATGAVVIKTVEMHTGGEPVRIVVDGYPTITGTSILEKRRFARSNYDHLRKRIMWEPRYGTRTHSLTP